MMRSDTFFASIILFCFLLFTTACTKYEEEILSGNIVPPDGTVSNLAIESYINKVFISVLGREPIPSEFNTAWNSLSATNASVASRKIFVDGVFSNNEYYTRMYDLARADYLENLDTTEITNQILLYDVLLADSTYFLFWDIIQYEKDRMVSLQQIPNELLAGTIDIKEVQKRCSNNDFFDEINMGSLNFVVAVFQNIIRRYPTVQELDAGINMVDGVADILFFQTGQTKDDFLDIFFDSTDYYEGQVRDLYLRYLLREPNSAEMSAASIKYKNTDDYKQLQKDILILDEYMGI